MTQQTDNRTSGNGSAVADPEPSTSGDSDLDTLLKGYQPGAQSPTHNPILARLSPVIAFAEKEMASQAVAAFEKDVQGAVEFLADSEDTKALPQIFVRGFLDAYAVQNPDVREAFAKRGEDPAGWRSALGRMKTDFDKDAKALLNGRIRSDVEAAQAAVAGQSSQQSPDQPIDSRKLNKMSDHEFNAFKAGLAGA